MKVCQIMAINSSLDGLKKDVIKNLSKDKLKSYIFYLTKKYYKTFIEGDEEAFNNNLEQIYAIINEYRDTYVNLMGFVFYCLQLNANVIMMKSSNNSFELRNIAKYDLFEDDTFEDDLRHDIKEIFNKERVKERYYEKRTSELIKQS